MLKRTLKAMLNLLLFTISAGLLFLSIPRLITALHAHSRTASVDEVTPRRVAVVFGAGLWEDGSPTPILQDRVATAAELYLAGKVEYLLMSGDNRFVDYNEPSAMREYALSLGVPHDDIVLDYAGRRTYDTCYRAGDIFGLDEAILVTQSFHLPRALYTCNALGLAATGVPADQRQYRRSSMLYWQARETLATLVALWEIHVTHPLPVLGELEEIKD